MPKMKSKSGVKKRYKLTASGKLKRYRCNAGHILTKKNAKRRRRLRSPEIVSPTMEKRIKQLLVV